jgi:tetratricopeptide (TPR) repeat protein
VGLGANNTGLDYYDPMSRFTRFVVLSTLACGLGSAALAAETPTPAFTNSALDGPLLEQLLVSEMTARLGDNAMAHALMMDAARKAKSAKLYQRAVEMALRARDGDLAWRAAQAWTFDFPESPEAHSYLLQILVELNNFSQVPEAIKRSLAAAPAADRPSLISQLPRYFLRTTDKQQAASTLEKALANELNNKSTGPNAWSAIGFLREKAGNSKGALEAARRGAALNPQADEPLFLAIALMDPQLPAAEAMVRKHLSGTASAPVRMTYVRTLLNTERYEEGYAQTLTLTKQQPDFLDAWLVRGSLELQAKKWGMAQASLKRYIELDAKQNTTPNQVMGRGVVQANILLSQIAEQQNDLDAALQYLAGLDNPADTLRVETRRARIWARMGKLDDARRALRNIPELKAEDARTKLNAEVQLLRDYKQYPAAYELLTQAAAKEPNDTDLLYDLAMMADKLGKLDQMEQLLRQIIAQKPDSQQAYNALGYSYAERNIRIPEARTLILKALEFAPNDPFIVDSLGWVEFRAGNLNEALKLLRQAYQAQPDPEIAAHLGEVLWTQGEREQAEKIWAEGLQQAPDNTTLTETVQRLRGKP